jgi:hypothetical protein
MTIKTLLAAGSVAALLAGPALAQTTMPSNGETQRDQSRQDRAAQTNTNNMQGRANANENAGFGTASSPDTGGQDGAIREGAQILDGAGNVIGVITKIQRTRDGEIRSVTVRFEGFGRVTLKLVPKAQLKIQGTVIKLDLTREQIQQLQDAAG